jgi:elongation factor Ts
MEISNETIKQLREETGVSVMQCKKALQEADGDVEKAKLVLREESGRIAEKKADRELDAGVVSAYIHNSRDVGALVELSCETDFVAKNEEFVQLAYDVAMHVVASNPEFLTRDEVTEESIERAREVFEKEAEGKPEEIKEKILNGKLDSFYAETVLMEQPYVKDNSVTVQKLLENAVQKFGERIMVTAFTRYSVR